MNPSCLLLLVFLPLLHSQTLTVSTDNGVTWTEPTSPETLPSYVLVRAAIDPDAPHLYLPRCAVSPAPTLVHVHLSRSEFPIGLRLHSAPGCEKSDVRRREGRITSEVAPVLEPQWAEFVATAEEAMRHDEEQPKKGASLFGKYALYIMGFIAIALFQGIRTGFAELQEEIEREEAQKRAASARQEGQVRVAVPRRKAKGKRRPSATGRGTSAASTGNR